MASVCIGRYSCTFLLYSGLFIAILSIVSTKMPQVDSTCGTFMFVFSNLKPLRIPLDLGLYFCHQVVTMLQLTPFLDPLTQNQKSRCFPVGVQVMLILEWGSFQADNANVI